MANNKNKIKELVADDDDPTAELEALAVDEDELLESDANTFNFSDDEESAAVSELRSDLKDRSETISRLQFDIEQLRSRWLGLEAEIKSREEITKNLQSELDEQQAALARKQDLVKERDGRIESLKSELREREEQHQALQQQFDALDQNLGEQSEQLADLRSTIGERDDSIAELEDHNAALKEELESFSQDEIDATQSKLLAQAGQLASDADAIRNLETKLANSEQYADSIRQQLSDLLLSNREVEETRLQLQGTIAESSERIEELSSMLEDASGKIADLTEELTIRDNAHAEEIRTLRFELGEAQETAANSETLNEQLATDLYDTRGHKEKLERMLSEHDDKSAKRIEELEKEVERLSAEGEELEHKLEAKSEAINCLLEEVARKSEQIDSIGEIEQVIHDIDDRMSESIDVEPPPPSDRVTRLLVGEVDDQVLRFPLFKDRLTIGRTSSNDIQLKKQYISRRHAVILTEGDTTRVVDWGSKNGVYVNSKRVSEHFLKNGDVVTIGTNEFRYEERNKRD